MAVAQSVLSETQRETLEALCDTFVPAVETDSHDPLEKEFIGRAASDMDVAAQIEGLMAEAMMPEEILPGRAACSTRSPSEGFAAGRPSTARTQIVHAFCDAGPGGKARPPPAQGA